MATTGTPVGPFGFAGGHGYQEDGDSGLKLLGHRYYDPSTGRFLTRDPIQDGRNWYAYCDGNPLRAVDPTGLLQITFTLGVSGQVGYGGGSLDAGVSSGDHGTFYTTSSAATLSLVPSLSGSAGPSLGLDWSRPEPGWGTGAALSVTLAVVTVTAAFTDDGDMTGLSVSPGAGFGLSVSGTQSYTTPAPPLPDVSEPINRYSFGLEQALRQEYGVPLLSR